jgi:hypothetical protein
MLFNNLLKEAIENKQFESVEALVKAVKSVLRKASFPRYKENKANSEKGFASPSQYGYKYKYLNGAITISFFGAERSWVSELARALKTVEINFHFNEKQDIFLIKSLDNVKPLDLMDGDAVEEYEKGTFGVIGTKVDSKHDIKTVIDEFTSTQRSIYFELVRNEMVEWKMIKVRIGQDSVKFKYKLVAIKIETDK